MGRLKEYLLEHGEFPELPDDIRDDCPIDDSEPSLIVKQPLPNPLQDMQTIDDDLPF